MYKHLDNIIACYIKWSGDSGLVPSASIFVKYQISDKFQEAIRTNLICYSAQASGLYAKELRGLEK